MVKQKTQVKDAKGAALKQSDSQRKADEKSLQEEQDKKKKNERKPSGISTTDGRIIRNASVKFIKAAGITIVANALYGKLIEGKTGKEAEANLKKLPNRALSKDDLLQYQRLADTDPKAALEFAVKAAYPMHVDDRAFGNAVGEVNGKSVNYIVVKKLTEDDIKDKNGVVNESSRNLIGRWQLRTGIAKGENTVVILTPEETAMYRHRAEVKLDSKGSVVSVGKPVTMLELADRAVRRSLADRQTREAALSEAKGIDWGQYHAPLGARLTHLYTKDSNEADRQWINGKVNSVEVKGALLTAVETVALREGLATREQVFMHNAFTRQQAFDLNKANYQDLKAHAEEHAVKAIVDRAKNTAPHASFTREQVDMINLAVGRSEDREGVITSLYEKAEVQLKESNEIDMNWLDAVKDELKDIVENKWEVKSESASVSR